jgi:hypothetical protein
MEEKRTSTDLVPAGIAGDAYEAVPADVSDPLASAGCAAGSVNAVTTASCGARLVTRLAEDLPRRFDRPVVGAGSCRRSVRSGPGESSIRTAAGPPGSGTRIGPPGSMVAAATRYIVGSPAHPARRTMRIESRDFGCGLFVSSAIRSEINPGGGIAVRGEWGHCADSLLGLGSEALGRCRSGQPAGPRGRFQGSRAP